MALEKVKVYAVTRLDENDERLWFTLQDTIDTGWRKRFDCLCLTLRKAWAERIANFSAYKKLGAEVVEFDLDNVAGLLTEESVNWDSDDNS